MLSGRTDSTDKVEAFDAGADDYVTKPFGIDELLARIRAALRRTNPAPEQPVIEMGRARIDLPAKRVTIDGKDIRLTPTEWHLLEVLVLNPGKLMSRTDLLTEVWGPGYATASGNLRFYIGQLRRKLEADPASPQYLLTEPGMGYRFEPTPGPSQPTVARNLIPRETSDDQSTGYRGPAGSVR